MILSMNVDTIEIFYLLSNYDVQGNSLIMVSVGTISMKKSNSKVTRTLVKVSITFIL